MSKLCVPLEGRYRVAIRKSDREFVTEWKKK